jgi:hypothetical protein
MSPYEADSDLVIPTFPRARCEGNFRAHIEDLKRGKEPEADPPHRVTYWKLVRG